ncbi:MAG: amylo-alpha-1,6-glucosidase [Clostridia bacterium]|nr:amylo-alpha-1,6-glucosidase [Clostridia bacterium]
MKYTKVNLENGLKKEWIITNGIGGYASSTIIGANTRRYHGLLVAPLVPPARRHLILSKLDESIQINGKNHMLFTNIGKDYITEGYKNLQSFEKEFIPIYTYTVENVIIKKVICMEYGKNTVAVMYRIKNAENQAKITLAPVVNFRDFHGMMTDHNFDIEQEINGTKTKIIVDNKYDTPIYMKTSEGNYIKHNNDIFKNMYYVEEEKRGFFPEENHVVTGRYEIEIAPNEQKDITFVCSLEENIDEVNVAELISKEITRINEIIYDSRLNFDGKKEIVDERHQDMVKNFITAADSFIVYRPSFGLHTIIAGYPWFLDWGRDSLISFEGLLLVPKRYEIARQILQLTIKDVKYGLVPNGYSEYDNSPLYNSVDSSLLLFEQVKKYLNYTEDKTFIKSKIYDCLVKIIDSYVRGINVYDNNIFLDEDFLISSGSENTQNTWMDAKFKNIAITPRNGKAVEINALWYNALKIMEELSILFKKREQAELYRELSKKCKESFENKFYNKNKKCLYDVLGDEKVRPNQLFALSLSYPVIEPSSEIAKDIINVVEEKLLNNYGLKTLAKGEKNYIAVYEGDSFKRDMSYHQGITWPWLLGLYYDSLRNIMNAEKDKIKKQELNDKLKEFKDNVEKVFSTEMVDSTTVGSIHEIYDSKKPYRARGTISQAWSVAEVLRIIFS